jgi:phosphatidylcholine synthase
MSVARVKAFLVHVYTASTMIILLISSYLLLHDQLNLALFVMLLAVAIDSSDGTLARRFHVKEVYPELDGRRLDDIVDYVSYVFLPVVFMLKAQMLSEPVVLFGSLPLLASAFGFSRVDAKLDDEGFFVGFPSYWNVIVAYLYLLSTPPWLTTLVIVVLSVMVFIPTRYLYITRMHKHRWLHIGATFICGMALLAGLFVQDPTRRLLLYFSLTYPVYYTIYSFVLDRRARKAVG